MFGYRKQLTTFYRNYDARKINNTYENMCRQYSFFPHTETNFFSGEIRMKKHILALQIDSDSLLSDQELIILGYFFEYYHQEKNCVWTKSKDKIKKLFTDGLSYLRYFGGKIKLNLSRESVETVVKILSSKNDSMTEDLCENFYLLEEMSWSDYEKQTIKKLQKEKEQQHIADVTRMVLAPGWINPYATDERATDIHTESIGDGLALSLNHLGAVDIEYISQVTGESYSEVILALKGAIYQNPDTVLNYAEVKAIAVGNPLIKKRVKVANELFRNRTLQKKQEESNLMLEAELARLPREIEHQKKIIANYQQDADFYQRSKKVYSAEQRKLIREQIYRGIVANELSLKERVICSYQGFDITLPANMTKRHPFVYLEKHGRYYIPMGDKASGILIRIDNFLKGMEEQLAKQKDKLESMRLNEKKIKGDLKKASEYIKRITELMSELAEIDNLMPAVRNRF